MAHRHNSCILRQMKLKLVGISNGSCLPQFRNKADDLIVILIL